MTEPNGKLDAPLVDQEGKNKWSLRKFLADAIGLFAIACVCFVALVLAYMWFHAWQRNMYPFVPRQGMHPPWSYDSTFKYGFNMIFHPSMLAMVAAVLSCIIKLSWRSVVVLSSVVGIWIVIIWHVLSLTN